MSTAEVTRAAMARAEAWQPRIQAQALADWDGALHRAAQPAPGCFRGVPTFVKDMEDVEGLPTRFGSVALPPRAAPRTAASVAQFLGTGLVCLGKSTTAEFGLTATTEPLHGAPTRNPVALGHSAGGSSGGAAALVASGVVPIAHGGDGGGSIRIPAAFCGLVGLKASRGRLVDMASAGRMPVKIATYGVVTRSVRDTAAFFGEVDRPRGGMPPIGRVRGPGPQKLRVGLFVDGPLDAPCHPDVLAALHRAARELESQGHRVQPVPAPYDKQVVDDFLLHWGVLAAAVLAVVRFHPGGDLQRLEPWTHALAAQARRRWRDVPGAVLRLRRFPVRYARAFDDVDVILSPTTAQPAPPLGHLSPSLPYEQKVARLLRLLPYTPVQNASGGPAISVPAGRSAGGLPMGVQLAAPWGGERRLLELAFALEGRLA